LIEPYWIEVKEQPVYISNLPEAFEGFRIVQLSDLHGKRFANKEIGLRVNKLKPDLVVITGDVFDQSEETPVQYLGNVLEGLNAKFGTYFVFGNNEFYMNKQNIKEMLALVNVRTLINESVSLTLKGSHIYLVGIDDPYSQNYDLSKALHGTGPEPKILLAHTPEIIHVAEKYGVDLTLAGHTHGGQIQIPFFPRLISNVGEGYEQYLAGLFNVGNTQMYVNRGLGENDIPMRFLTRPEITVIVLQKELITISQSLHTIQ
jgi:predicted MPP superfamily phosphohydrolase